MFKVAAELDVDETQPDNLQMAAATALLGKGVYKQSRDTTDKVKKILTDDPSINRASETKSLKTLLTFILNDTNIIDAGTQITIVNLRVTLHPIFLYVNNYIRYTIIEFCQYYQNIMKLYIDEKTTIVKDDDTVLDQNGDDITITDDNVNTYLDKFIRNKYFYSYYVIY